MPAAFTHPPVHSPWFDFAQQQPWEPGVYEVETSTGQKRFARWNGFEWRCTADSPNGAEWMSNHATACTITRWRGIIPPSRLPRFVSETWEQACARVPELKPVLCGLIQETVTDVFTLADCMPGYDLVSIIAQPLVLTYRRRDPL